MNERNGDALQFSHRKGFAPVGRSAFDGDGRPDPIVLLALPLGRD